MSIVDGQVPAAPSKDELRRIEVDFIEARERGEPLAAWLQRYPEHALALTDLAIALDLNTDDIRELAPAQEDLTAAARALRQAREEVFDTPPSPTSPGLVARARSLGIAVPHLARQLRLAGDILFKLDRGFIQPETVPRQLCMQLAVALKLPLSSLPGGLIQVQGGTALYYADQKPVAGNQQSFAEALAQSEALDDEDRRAWLAALQAEGLVA